MSQAQKRLQDMRANPMGWTMEDVEVVSRAYGVSCEPPSRGGHYKISHRTQSDILTIPKRPRIKPVYIKRFVSFVDAVAGARS